MFSDSSLLPCSCIQLTLSCQVLLNQYVQAPPTSLILVCSCHCLAKYCRISDFWLFPPPMLLYTADIVLPSTAASVCIDSSLLPCSCIQLTLSCQILPHHCVQTAASSRVLVYSWHCLAKYCRTSAFWLLPPPSSHVPVCSWHYLAKYCRISMFRLVSPHQLLYTAGIVLPSPAASACIDSSLIPCTCIQLTLSCQVLPYRSVQTLLFSPFLVLNWYYLAKYYRIIVLWLLPLFMFLYTAVIVLPSTTVSLCFNSPPPPLFLYTVDIVLPRTAPSVCSDSSLLSCSCIQLALSCQILPHLCVQTLPSSPFLVFSWHYLAKYCHISVFWLFPLLMFLYTVDIVLSSTAVSLCFDSFLRPCSCIQQTWSCQVPPHQWVQAPPSSPVLVYSWYCLAKYCRFSMFWLLPPLLFLDTADIVLPSTAASVCSDSSLLSCSWIQLTLSCQVLPHQCVLTPPSSPVLEYSWHCLAKYCRSSVSWHLSPPLFLYTTGILLPSSGCLNFTSLIAFEI